MTHGKRANNFIVIEHERLTVYPLDDKNVWEIGRVSKENHPDIILHAATVSRRHGRFQNVDGVWFYLDYNGKNGTVYNQRHITSGLSGRVKPVALKDGDVFVFGAAVWGLYITRDFEESWRIADSSEYAQIQLMTEGGITILNRQDKGAVIEKDKGIAIYMGDFTYLIGDVEMKGY